LYGSHPDLTLVHLSVRASWLNQAEIFCSIVQRKVLRPNCFEHLAQLARRRASSSPTTTRVPSPSTGRSYAPTSPSYSNAWLTASHARGVQSGEPAAATT
jgi:hypothetical protein